MTLVKVCGLRTKKDVLAAKGADYLGFVIATGTRRSLRCDEARELMDEAGKPTVAVTTSSKPDLVLRIAEELEPYAVQLNGPAGGRTITSLQEVGCKAWVAVHIGATAPVLDMGVMDLADCVVLDTASPEGGGSGLAHDHAISARVAGLVRRPVSLAGGLNPENVAQAISMVRPDIVDVSSGVETNGVKDALKIERFIEEVKRCQ